MEQSTENILQQLFQSNNPQELFTEIYNKSLHVSGKQNNLFSEGNDSLPPVQLKNRVTAQSKMIPKISPQQVDEQTNKNHDTLKNLLGQSYFNNLLNKPAESVGSSIFESLVPNVPSFGDYEVMDAPKQTPPSSDQISLKIEGKSYIGKIIQNKKGQILFLINNHQAFILTPSNLKTVSKKA